jgi:hypothetical protein
MGDQSTAKNAATESKNNTQYRPVLFLVVSILIILGKYKAEQCYLYFFWYQIANFLCKVVYCRFVLTLSDDLTFLFALFN